MPSPVPALALSDMDRQQVQQWVSAFGTPQQVVLRCRIVLGAAAGQSENSLAQQLKTNRNTVRLWRARFTQQGAKSLWEIAAGRGRKPTYGPEKIKAIIDTTLQTKPKGRSQWSCRSLAKRTGVSKSTVNNIWRSHHTSLGSHPTRLADEEGALRDHDARLQAQRDDHFVRGPRLEMAQGKVVGECYQRHRHQEFLKFLRRLDEEFPGPGPLPW